MLAFGLDFAVALDILETGTEAGFTRGPNVVERAAVRKGRRIKIVARKAFDVGFDEQEVWNIVHVGPDTRGAS
jgi:hypothetical protein